jgi:serine/threonine-protein kinase
MLTGEVPFIGDSAISIALEHLNNVVPSVMEQNMNVPQSLENVIRKATAKRPSNRYKDATQLHEDLETALNPERTDEKVFVEKREVENQEDLEKTRVMVNEKYSRETTQIMSRTKRKKERMKRTNAPLYGMFFVIAILVTLIGLFVVVIPRITANKDILVPDVVGLDRVSAEFELRNSGFLIDSNIVYAYSDDVDEGKVISTNPRAGQVKKEGSYIKLFISRGLEKITLDSYFDQDVNLVKTNLEAKGLIVKIIYEEVEANEGYTEGLIMKQFPGKGAVLTKGQQVQLYVPDIVSTYPDFVGNADQVKINQFCSDYNLQCHIEEEYSETIAQGVVTRQSRAEGERIVSNAHFTVYISKGKEPAEE